jgi:hypothetical protein
MEASSVKSNRLLYPVIPTLNGPFIKRNLFQITLLCGRKRCLISWIKLKLSNVEKGTSVTSGLKNMFNILD